MNFRLFNFLGNWILSNSIFWDIRRLILDEHPCQINACMPPPFPPPPPRKRELRSAEYQLSQLIEGQIAMHIVLKWQWPEISKFDAIIAHIKKNQ